MDALDNENPGNDKDEQDDGGEENVDADEREGNQDFSKQPNSQDQEDELEDNEHSRNVENQNLQIEERMKRLKLSNEKSHEEGYETLRSADPNMMQYNNMAREMSHDPYENTPNSAAFTPNHENYSENYQNFDDYGNGPQDNYQNDQQDGQQNNMLIMQYESVLQSVNREFQKLLNKNKETEEELSLTKMK